MRTTEEVLTEAFQTVKSEGAQTMPDRSWVEPRSPRRAPRYALAFGVAAIALGLIVLPGVLTGDTEPAVGDGASGPPTIASVEFVSNDDLQPKIEGYSETGAFWTADWKIVDETLAATGNTFDAYPSLIADSAVVDGRAVITGGEVTDGSGGIWYSDGGAWTAATIIYPEGFVIGGDGYSLFDTRLHLASSYDSYVAWANVSQGTGYEGALLITSEDGATWTATLHPNMIGGVIAWKDGYLAAVNEPIEDFSNARYVSQNGLAASLTWTIDFVDWAIVAGLEDGVAYDVVLDGSTIYVLMETARTETTGELFVAVIETE